MALRAFQTPAAVPDGSKAERAARRAVNEVSRTQCSERSEALHILEYEYRNKQTAQYLLSTDRILEIGL